MANVITPAQRVYFVMKAGQNKNPPNAEAELTLGLLRRSFFHDQCTGNHQQIEYCDDVKCSVCVRCGHLFSEDLVLHDVVDPTEHEFPSKEDK